ncbi:unnamed protein product [Heterobilharzia americana]|nr:unnamed protein product [Heterobilharzia americana]
MTSQNKKYHIFYVEIVIILLTGIGGLLSLISVCVRESWISGKFIELVHLHSNDRILTKCETSCLLAIIGTICSVTSAVVGILRIRLRDPRKTKRCKTAQFIYLIAGFISLLSSVAFWADFLRHLPHEIGATYHLRKLAHPQTPVEGEKIISQHKISITSLSSNTTTAHLHQTYLPVKWKKYKETIQNPSHLHLDANYLFGWAYWFCVVSVIFLFLSNLIYLMRKDCEHEQSIEIS